jgi:cytoskeletal protein CcmA (bactofilin family)
VQVGQHRCLSSTPAGGIMGPEEVTPMRTVTRFALTVLAAGLVALPAAAPAGAQSDDNGDIGDNLVVITGRADVREGEKFDHVVIIDGPVVVDGEVDDSVVAVNGDVRIAGTVGGDVAAFDGRVTIFSGGRVEGDITARRRPVVEPGGTLEGSWERWNPQAWTRATTIVTRLAVWLAVTVSTLVLGLLMWLLAPRAVTAAVDAPQRGLGPVIGWGLLLTIGLPIVAVIAMVTLVGLPLGLGLLLALGLIYGIGYTTGAWLLGRRVASRASPVPAFLAGWGILRVLALVPILGGLVGFVAVVFGLGALAVAGWRARSPAAAEPPAAPPPAPAADTVTTPPP